MRYFINANGAARQFIFKVAIAWIVMGGLFIVAQRSDFAMRKLRYGFEETVRQWSNSSHRIP